jgi:hypothetical protein
VAEAKKIIVAANRVTNKAVRAAEEAAAKTNLKNNRKREGWPFIRR